MIKILIIEDHKLLIQGLKELLGVNECCQIEYEALTGREGLFKVQAIKDIDLVLLDVNLPDMHGADICQKIKELRPDLPVLILTMHASSNHVKRLLTAGANGYVLKDCSDEELIEAIDTVHRGKLYLSGTVNKVLQENRDKNALRDASSLQMPKLTSREVEILGLILEEFTTDEMATRLNISPHTIISHRKNLLSKLQVRNTAGLVRVAFEKDLIYEYLKKNKKT